MPTPLVGDDARFGCRLTDGGVLELRPWRVEDAEALHRAVTASIDHLRPWMAWIAFEPLTVDERAEMIQRWRLERNTGGDAVLGIFVDGVACGGTGWHRRRGPGVLEIGYWVALSHVRRGIATETARLLTAAAWAVPGIERSEIHHDKANAASGAVARRLGYELTGERPEKITAPGECGIDCCWQALRPAPAAASS